MTNYKWGPVPERHTATLIDDDVNDDKVLKTYLKEIFIPLKSDMSSPDWTIVYPLEPSLSEDVFQQKHPATLEARLEKLRILYATGGKRPHANALLSLRLLDGSSRKADDPLALATERLLFEPYPKMFWDKLDISDQDDLKTPATIRGRRISLFSGNSCCELLHVEEKSLNMVKPTKMVVWVEIARRHGPHGEMRCGGPVHITANVTTTVITMRELTATNCKDDTREKIAGLLRQYVETTSMSDGDLGRSSIRHNRLRKFVESVKPIKRR
ncbi:Triosephosphate isomerase [Trichinella spiralis]|uniref:Triosephosphate isomerase n=1 Tax=Trichinella spiralis TaxID=6334 RepID=A0ABR3L2P0_TRISP